MKRKLATDVLLNLAASFLLTATLQFLVLPMVARRIPTADFGDLLTIVGVANAVGVTFGTTLNNIYLIRVKDVDRRELDNTFTRLLFVSLSACLALSVAIVMALVRDLSPYFLVLFGVYACLLVMRGYLQVYFRIRLNYKLILAHMVVTSVGYCVGFLVFYRWSTNWLWVYIVGELCSLVFLLARAKVKLDFRRQHARSTGVYADFRNYLLSAGLANTTVYLDRIIINPILGPAEVAVYFAASVVGKTLGMVIQPMAGVLLSYNSVGPMINRRRTLLRTLALATCVGLAFWVVAFFVTPPLIRVMYPSVHAAAMGYYPIYNIVAVMNMTAALVQSLALKIAPTRWQVIIQAAYFSAFLITALLGMLTYSLAGFLAGHLVAAVLQVVLVILVAFKYSKATQMPRHGVGTTPSGE